MCHKKALVWLRFALRVRSGAQWGPGFRLDCPLRAYVKCSSLCILVGHDVNDRLLISSVMFCFILKFLTRRSLSFTAVSFTHMYPLLVATHLHRSCFQSHAARLPHFKAEPRRGHHPQHGLRGSVRAALRACLSPRMALAFSDLDDGCSAALGNPARFGPWKSL